MTDSPQKQRKQQSKSHHRARQWRRRMRRPRTSASPGSSSHHAPYRLAICRLWSQPSTVIATHCSFGRCCCCWLLDDPHDPAQQRPGLTRCRQAAIISSLPIGPSRPSAVSTATTRSARMARIAMAKITSSLPHRRTSRVISSIHARNGAQPLADLPPAGSMDPTMEPQRH